MGDLIGPNPTNVGGPKSEITTVGSMRTFVCDRQTDSAGYMRTREQVLDKCAAVTD